MLVHANLAAGVSLGTSEVRLLYWRLCWPLVTICHIISTSTTLGWLVAPRSPTYHLPSAADSTALQSLVTDVSPDDYNSTHRRPSLYGSGRVLTWERSEQTTCRYKLTVTTSRRWTLCATSTPSSQCSGGMRPKLSVRASIISDVSSRYDGSSDQTRLPRTVVSAFVLSGLDYCNAVLAGLPKSSIAPLQRAQTECCSQTDCATLSTRYNNYVRDCLWTPQATCSILN